MFEERLVLMTSKAIRKVSGPADIGRSTLIAFAQGCSYRKRIEEWLGSANVMPERVLEFASYQAMIACVAAGTGFAVVPKSVLEALRATQEHAPARAAEAIFAQPHPSRVERRALSPSLHGLLALLTSCCTLHRSPDGRASCLSLRDGVWPKLQLGRLAERRIGKQRSAVGAHG